MFKFIAKFVPTDDGSDSVLEVDSGSFRWKGWMPKKDKTEQNGVDAAQCSSVDPDYDVVEQPFLLQDISIQIQKVGRFLCVTISF